MKIILMLTRMRMRTQRMFHLYLNIDFNALTTKFNPSNEIRFGFRQSKLHNSHCQRHFNTVDVGAGGRRGFVCVYTVGLLCYVTFRVCVFVRLLVRFHKCALKHKITLYMDEVFLSGKLQSFVKMCQRYRNNNQSGWMFVFRIFDLVRFYDVVVYIASVSYYVVDISFVSLRSSSFSRIYVSYQNARSNVIFSTFFERYYRFQI